MLTGAGQHSTPTGQRITPCRSSSLGQCTSFLFAPSVDPPSKDQRADKKYYQNRSDQREVVAFVRRAECPAGHEEIGHLHREQDQEHEAAPPKEWEHICV